MNWKQEWKPFAWMAGIFLAFFFLPMGGPRVSGAVVEALELTKWYAREHVILCLLPALFIAGAIGVFVGQASVMKYLGANANKILAYGVASVSGSVLAVCSCTVLPLFAGIYRMGAGLGPACAFLYSGPAINVLAIILTARILGMDIGIARAIGAVTFSIIIGLLMHMIFRKEEAQRVAAQSAELPISGGRKLWKTTLYFAAMILLLIFATWGEPSVPVGLWETVFQVKWWLTSAAALLLGAILIRWFGMKWLWAGLAALPPILCVMFVPDQPLLAFGVGVVAFSAATYLGGDETREWFEATWGFAKQIMPLLFFGVLVSGFLLGRPGHEGVIPSEWVSSWVGGNSLSSNFLASLIGALMYFATLTEVPIVQGLIGSGMGKGPALALLLAGPALSLPSMLVIRSILGTKKMLVFVSLVVVMATITGMVFGQFIEG